CIIYMGSEDMRRQALNVLRIRMLGGTVIPATTGSCTLKDAINEAMRDLVTNVQNTYYLVGSAIGCHPFPTMVRDFQCVIGKETKEQMQALTGRLPDAVVACVGGGSNSIGMFHPFIDDKSVRLIGAEAAGDGVDTPKHSATITAGTLGVFHGAKTYLLQDKKGQIMETHSVSAGLDYPGVGPEHSWLKATGRAEYYGVTDVQALEGFRSLTQLEGIIPALESSHAVYQALQVASKMRADEHLVICISGRGDKDVNTVAEVLPKIGPQIGWDLRFEEDPTKIARK
ncbi:tryptophan synthetase, partial [Coemansia aciculifera]